jgi:hypothetical protein
MEDARQDVKQADRYVRLDIPYDPIMSGAGVLRPEIKIELATFPLRRPPVDMPVRSFVAQAQDHAPEAPKIACVSIIDTACDKLVGLARRAGEAYAMSSELDHTLVRHVYDLHRLDGHYDPAEAAALARQIMMDEAGRGYDAYAKDPRGETQVTISRMAQDEAFIANYDRLLNDMVYGERPAFPDAWAAVEAFARRIG